MREDFHHPLAEVVLERHSHSTELRLRSRVESQPTVKECTAVCRSHDTAAVAIIVVILSVIVVPMCVVVTLIDGNVCAVDTKELAEQAPLGNS